MNCISNFSELISHLHKFMEKVFAQTGKRTKRAVSRVQHKTLCWSATERTEFENFKDALAAHASLLHCNRTKRLCVYTDASVNVLLGIFIQVPTMDTFAPYADHCYGFLKFLSGRFNTAQLCWCILDKEAFSAMVTLNRMHSFVATSGGVDQFTDHNNLIFIFDPLSVVPDLSQTSVHRVLGWAFPLSMYTYTCFHISSNHSVWADLLGRWSAPTVRRLVLITSLCLANKAVFERWTESEIRTIQKEYIATLPNKVKPGNGLYRYSDNRICISDDSTDLQLRICTIGHTGESDHRGRNSTEDWIRTKFNWSTISEDVRAFFCAFIHCLSATLGRLYHICSAQPYLEQRETISYI